MADPQPTPEAYEAADANTREWVRHTCGNPNLELSPLSQERNRAIVDAVWPLAVQAGREAAARDIETVAQPYKDSTLGAWIYDHLMVAARIARGESGSVPMPGLGTRIADPAPGAEESP